MFPSFPFLLTEFTLESVDCPMTNNNRLAGPHDPPKASDSPVQETISITPAGWDKIDGDGLAASHERPPDPIPTAPSVDTPEEVLDTLLHFDRIIHRMRTTKDKLDELLTQHAPLYTMPNVFATMDRAITDHTDALRILCEARHQYLGEALKTMHDRPAALTDLCLLLATRISH